jgi:hypothetical protein
MTRHPIRRLTIPILLLVAGATMAQLNRPTYRASGQLFTPLFNQSNAADTNYKCLALGTIAANTVTKIGDRLVIELDVLNAAGASTRTFKANVGGTCAADATGFTGGFDFYSATASTAAGQTAHTIRLTCTANCTTSTATFQGAGGYTQTNGSATQGSAQATSATVNVTGTLALGFAFKDSASAVNTVVQITTKWLPAP